MINKFKARLTVRGNNQKRDTEYLDTYPPATKVAAIATLITFTSLHNLLVHQMDVEIIVLNGGLSEEICMRQHEGMIVPGQV